MSNEMITTSLSGYKNLLDRCDHLRKVNGELVGACKEAHEFIETEYLTEIDYPEDTDQKEYLIKEGFPIIEKLKKALQSASPESDIEQLRRLS